jgi:hypothetical protein
MRITRARALLELSRHGQTEAGVADFDREMGVHSHYDAQAVLRWLGY